MRCLWINTYVDKSLYLRCFVPLYEDVWRKEGIGHIGIERMFNGYIFVETDTPEKVHEELKNLYELSILLSMDDKKGKEFVPQHKEEEVFFNTILSDGIMKVSYVGFNRNRKINGVIGPLQSYRDNIVRVDASHRRAIVDVPLIVEEELDPETARAVDRMMEILTASLSEAEKGIYLPIAEYLKTHETIKNADVIELTGKGSSSTNRYLTRLVCGHLVLLQKRKH